MHLDDPVAQAVHDQLERAGVQHVQAIASAGEIHIVARIVMHEPIVGWVIYAAQREGRALMVALGGMIVDDIEDDFDTCRMQGFDH